MITSRDLDTHRLSTVANAFERDMVKFLRDLISEVQMTERIRQEMAQAEFDEIRVGPAGNILGRIGSGKTVILMDSHAGACDQLAGMASLVTAGKLIHELGMYDDFTLWVACTVQEGTPVVLPFHPECAVVTEPTSLRIFLGRSGRAEAEMLNESHPLAQSAIATYEALFELPPLANPVPGFIGPVGVPAIGFGPGDGAAQSAGERVSIRQLVHAAQFYAALPLMYVDAVKRH